MNYQINTPRIAFEQFEGETILIDFESGTYYSVGPIGSALVSQINAGLGEAEIIRRAQRKYAGAPAEIESGIRNFFRDLQREAILAECAEGSAIHPSPSEETGPAAVDFQTPVLNKYTDMKDLLLLDPIHEVDEQGWPKQKPDA
jgi:hypothetical protein